jgi:N-acetylmuramoyl-L-alanine amidase CwlA
MPIQFIARYSVIQNHNNHNINSHFDCKFYRYYIHIIVCIYHICYTIYTSKKEEYPTIMKPIQKNITTINFNTGNISRIKYIVIHYTANDGDTAQNNTKYFKSVNRSASAHYFVDENSIWQCVEDKDIAWHCGTSGTYYHKYCRNDNSIGIELCSRKDSKGTYYFKEETMQNAAELTKYLMDKYNITIDNVIRHYDVTHKTCPAPFVKDSNAWTAWKARIVKPATPPSQPSDTYEIVVSINKYYTSSDAAKKINSKGTMATGTYYIFKTSNGMINVTTKQGSAGSWINPSENIVKIPEPKPEPPQEVQMYRVRKSWGDAKSQIGAFSVLNNAKALADSRASEGYRVFDNDGKVVYTPVQPAPSPTPTPTPTNPTTPSVPEPAQEPVVIEKHSILGTSETTAEQMATYVLKHNQNPQIAVDIYDLAEMYLQEASIEGVRGDIAFAQSIYETGYFKYGGDVKPEQNNYSGIGATGGGVAGATFESPIIGVRAQIQHLKAYASKNGLQQDCVDPRYSLVTKGIAPNLEDLAGRWAVPGYNKTKYDSLDDALVAGETYGQYIWDIVVAMKNIVGIPKPIPEPIPEPENPVIEAPVEPDEPILEPIDDTNPIPEIPDDTDKDEIIPKVSFLRLIVDTIIKIIKLIMHK